MQLIIFGRLQIIMYVYLEAQRIAALIIFRLKGTSPSGTRDIIGENEGRKG
jgi:hypothetical protein